MHELDRRLAEVAWPYGETDDLNVGPDDLIVMAEDAQKILDQASAGLIADTMRERIRRERLTNCPAGELDLEAMALEIVENIAAPPPWARKG